MHRGSGCRRGAGLCHTRERRCKHSCRCSEWHPTQDGNLRREAPGKESREEAVRRSYARCEAMPAAINRRSHLRVVLAARAIAPATRFAGFAPLSLTLEFVGDLANCRSFALLRMTSVCGSRDQWVV